MGKLIAQYGNTDNGRFATNIFIDAINETYQNITFYGFRAHHNNGIVESKNKILTQGDRTLLLRGMRMWPQIINEMFWTFVIKYFAERHNSLKIGTLGKTPESILYGFKVEDIPVKS